MAYVNKLLQQLAEIYSVRIRKGCHCSQIDYWYIRSAVIETYMKHMF